MIEIDDIAVVIPYYNGSHFIERALKSVIAQTKQASEIIIVDDGSSQVEHDKLAELQPTYGFRLVRQENGGQGSARNLGVASTSSSYICFLDQDDFFLEWHIRHLVDVAEGQSDERFGYAYGDLWRCDEEGNVVQYRSRPSEIAFGSNGDYQTGLESDLFILPSASLISKQAFVEVGGFDDRLAGYEDDDLFLRLFLAGYTGVNTPRAVTCWTLNPNSTSNSKRMAQSRWIFIEKILKTFPRVPDANFSVLRDVVLPRFFSLLLSDFVKSCFFTPGTVGEERTRLQELRRFMLADPNCDHLVRVKFILGLFSRIPTSLVVRLGNLAASPLGAVLLGPIGKRTIRPMFKHVVGLSKNRNAD